ncbi:MAG: YaiO family outer membrane beta-barrel protein [Bacteroidetes bacterium]|nr:MAG: YaiO family outer membrane beta-barrel protein [Bacteroidota bacterium]
MIKTVLVHHLSILTKTPFRLLFLLWMLASSIHSQAQTSSKSDTVIIVTDTTDFDRLFKRARDIGNQKNYNFARKICYKILEKKPSYYDVRTYIGRTYSWEYAYDAARTEFSRVLIEKENDFEALAALIDVEYWTNNLDVASNYLKLAMGYYPTSEPLMLKKAKILLRQGDKEAAALSLRRVLDLNPGNKEAIDMLNSMSDSRLSNRFSISYANDYFDTRDPHKLAAIEIGRSFSFGSLIYRASYAEKFDKKGVQAEADGYLRIIKSNYFYVNLGYSDSRIFPDFRAAIESFQKLPASFELSVGYRYLRFSPPGTSIYTASLGKYYRNYWFAFRTYLTPKVSIGTENFLQKTSQTYILNIRNYFSDADNYLGIRIGKGQSPDERKLSDADTPRLNSVQAGLEYQRRTFGRWVAKGEVTVGQEELNSGYLNRISIGVQMKTVF